MAKDLHEETYDSNKLVNVPGSLRRRPPGRTDVVDSRLTRGLDDDGNAWAICQVCTERTTEENLALDPADGKRWDVCKDCYPKTVNLVCWDDETGIGYPTHDLNGDLDCRRCTHKANWCCVGDWAYSGEYGDAEWDECMRPAAFCGRPADGPGCMPVCGDCKQHIEANPDLKKKYGVVVFEPYDGRTSERFCSETCSHDDEWWDGWTLEPPVPAELEPSFTERLIAEPKAVRAELKTCARDANAIRPIPSQTALGYEHLMADADRTALIAEADRLTTRCHAVLELHRPVEAYDRVSRRVYHYCWECSDDGGDGSRGHIEWPCDTAKAAGAKGPQPTTVSVTVGDTITVFEVVPLHAVHPCIDRATGRECEDHTWESSTCDRCGFVSAPCEGVDRGWDGWAEDCEHEAEWLTVVGTSAPTVKSYCHHCAEGRTKVYPRPLTT